MGIEECTNACQVKKGIFFFTFSRMKCYCIFSLFRGTTLKRKMADSPEQAAEPPFHDDTDLTTTVEKTKDEFSKWAVEEKHKCVYKQIITTPNYKIDVGKVGHPIVWNIYNLRCNQNAKFPSESPSTEMVGGAKAWIEAFRSYSLGVMKDFVMKEYVRIFNSPKYKNLRGTERKICCFNEIVEKMKQSEDEEV